MQIEPHKATSDDAKSFPNVRRFFFAQEVPFGLAAIRICLPLLLLVDVTRRWPHARELFSTDGATAPLAEAYGFPNLLPEFSGSVVVALYTVLVFCLLNVSLGWFTRASLIISAILYPYFCMLDSLSSVTKYVVFSSHILLLLSLSRPGLIWSVDSWLAKRRKTEPWPAGPSLQLPTTSAWPRRLIQLLIAFMYFGAAFTKVHTPAFFSGEQMQFWLMTNIYYAHPIGDYFSQYPIIGVVGAYGTLVWEILFVACAWSGWGRRWMLGIGAAFHIGTFIMFGIIIFPLVMLTSYFSFLNERDMQTFSAFARRHWQRLGWSLKMPELPSHPPQWMQTAAVFVGSLCLFSLTGVAVEHQLDHYGIRHPDGRYTLERIPEEEARTLLRGDTTIREQDKFLSLNVGNMGGGGHLWNTCSEFHTGELIMIQASLNPPHGDMWIECNLHDEQENQLSRVGQIVLRDHHRSFFQYRLDNSFDPGRYHLILKSGGREVTRRTITLLPGETSHDLSAPVAN